MSRPTRISLIACDKNTIDIHQDAHSYPVMNNPRVMNSRQLIDNLLDVITPIVLLNLCVMYINHL